MGLLLVEDDSRVADFLTRGLEAEGYAVAHAGDGPQGLTKATSENFDVLILDVMLPASPAGSSASSCAPRG
jgi:DNA-binding response OmpR family regulator